MEAVSEVVVIAVVEEDDGRELHPVGHPVGVVGDDGLTNGRADLRACVEGDL
jgi:hypothetical protein